MCVCLFACCRTLPRITILICFSFRLDVAGWMIHERNCMESNPIHLFLNPLYFGNESITLMDFSFIVICHICVASNKTWYWGPITTPRCFLTPIPWGCCSSRCWCNIWWEAPWPGRLLFPATAPDSRQGPRRKLSSWRWDTRTSVSPPPGRRRRRRWWCLPQWVSLTASYQQPLWTNLRQMK